MDMLPHTDCVGIHTNQLSVCFFVSGIGRDNLWARPAYRGILGSRTNNQSLESGGPGSLGDQLLGEKFLCLIEVLGARNTLLTLESHRLVAGKNACGRDTIELAFGRITLQGAKMFPVPFTLVSNVWFRRVSHLMTLVKAVQRTTV